jgi:hypothetical protein
MERHPFKESTTEVGDGPTKVPCCGKGTWGGGGDSARQKWGGVRLAGARQRQQQAAAHARVASTETVRGEADVWARPLCRV